MNDLTGSDCQLLTEEVLKKCWHPNLWPLDNGYCPKCGEVAEWRTFLTGNDMIAVKEAIEKMGKWAGFWNYSHSIWVSRGYAGFTGDFLSWLMHPPRFCKLAARWRRKEKERAI